MYGKLKAHPGQGEALAAILLEAAEQAETTEGCELYIVNVAEDDPDTIWVTELWRDAAAHEASLRDEETLAMIMRAKPLIAGVEPVKLRPLGGKGYR
nr:antibiotic biosynthesis monooxygenase [Paenibacillus flagellatus]